jgi:hypothetical protein
MNQLLLTLEQSWLALALKSAFYIYPLVNALHILAIGTVVVSASLLDLRVLGILPRQSAAFAPLMRRCAIGGFVVAVLTGFSMFSIQASQYATNPAFRLKMLLLLLAAINFVIFYTLTTQSDNSGYQPIARLMALLSIVLWLAIVISGRFIAFV